MLKFEVTKCDVKSQFECIANHHKIEVICRLMH